jgi:hypothetical protein
MNGLIKVSIISLVNTVIKLPGYMKGGIFLHQLSDYQLLKKDSL